MNRCKNWLGVGPLFLGVALLGERFQGDGGAVRANEPPGQSKAVPPQTSEAADEKLEPEKLRADFRIARQALEEGHSGIYRYTSKKELDRVFDQAEKSLIRPMSTLEFYRVLAPVVPVIKCGRLCAARGVLPGGQGTQNRGAWRPPRPSDPLHH